MLCNKSEEDDVLIEDISPQPDDAKRLINLFGDNEVTADQLTYLLEDFVRKYKFKQGLLTTR
jgi:hypothetical protein